MIKLLIDQPELLTVIDLVMLCLLVLTACGAVFVRNLLVSVIFLSIFSLLMSTEYLVLRAPDVGITEAAVGAGISTVLFLTVLTIVPKQEKKPPTRGKWTVVLPMIVVLVTGLALCFAVSKVPPFGDASAPAHQYVASYYLENTDKDIGIPNVVTAILASYRGFDTLGETCVVLTAALSVLLLLSGKRSLRKH